jgi:hypothetical protein
MGLASHLRKLGTFRGAGGMMMGRCHPGLVEAGGWGRDRDRGAGPVCVKREGDRAESGLNQAWWRHPANDTQTFCFVAGLT